MVVCEQHKTELVDFKAAAFPKGVAASTRRRFSGLLNDSAPRRGFQEPVIVPAPVISSEGIKTFPGLTGVRQ